MTTLLHFAILTLFDSNDAIWQRLNEWADNNLYLSISYKIPLNK